MGHNFDVKLTSFVKITFFPLCFQADEPEPNLLAGSSKPQTSRSRSNESVASAISLTDSEDEAKQVSL